MLNQDSTEQNQLNQQTILIVDDEPEIRKLVSAMLTRQGFRGFGADTGENALKVFRSHPDVVLLLTDVISPGMSGPMLADRISALKPGIKVLFMSGYHSSQVVQRYVVEKGYSLIEKPFTMEQLGRKVREVLAGSHRPVPGQNRYAEPARTS